MVKFLFEEMLAYGKTDSKILLIKKSNLINIIMDSYKPSYSFFGIKIFKGIALKKVDK